MKRLGFALGTLALLAYAAPLAAGDPFATKLSKDKQAVHVLNRLTFGPRPGEVEQVRKAGIEKWIRQQLHPELIPENPVLAERLKSFETLQLANWQIAEKYQQPAPAGIVLPPRPAITQVVTPDQLQKLNNGTVDERLAVIMSIPADRLPTFLPSLSPAMLQGLPALAEQADRLRRADTEMRQRELQRLNPPLAQLLTAEQQRIARQGTPKEKRDLLMSFDQEKRRQVLRQLPPNVVNEVPELRREALATRQPQQFVNQELIEGKLLRALYSSRELEEVLVDFWVNHFNVFNGKGPVRVLLTSYERDAIRPHVLGHFRDLLLATARHPAMLYYLDNWQSQVPRDDLPVFTGPGAPRRPGLNENYGRELLELHTLGVDGGYTQDDVVAVARSFSGWTIYDVNKFAEFQFNPAVHDRKEKIVLGHKIPAGGGEQDGVQVIDILVKHPSTARFISRKLAQRFVADAPPQSLVDRMAATFTRTDGDLRAVLETMLTSREFLSEGAWQAKMKSPLELVLSAARALGADVTDTGALAQRVADLGQPLYGKLEPTGYPSTIEAWANSAGLLGRMNFASALTGGQVAGAAVDAARLPRTPRAATGLLGAGTPRDSLEKALAGAAQKDMSPATLAAVVIASPDFQRR
jgi:uncharacterized protein (DUF1800 family)